MGSEGFAWILALLETGRKLARLDESEFKSDFDSETRPRLNSGSATSHPAISGMPEPSFVG